MFQLRAKGALWAFVMLIVPTAQVIGQTNDGPVQSQLNEIREDFERKINELEHKYQSRIKALSDEVAELKAKSESEAVTELELGIARLVNQDYDHSNHASEFHNHHNPMISLTSDFVLSATDRENSSNEGNQFIVRELELSIQGHVDEYTTYHFFFFLNEEDLEVEEAFGLHLFDENRTFGIKAGRFNTPFTPVSRIHSHDLPFVDFPGVIQEYLGGNFRGTGIELFHNVDLESGGRLNFHLGVVNSLDGDSHTINGPLVGVGHEHEDEEDEFEPFGERSIENFAFYAHLEGRFQIGDATELRLGSSFALAPQIETTFLNELGVAPFEDHRELEKLVAAFDVALQIDGSDPGESFVIAIEVLLNRESFLDEDTAVEGRETAFGGFLWTEYRLDSEWAFGASVDLFQRAEDSSNDWWDAGIWATCNLSANNRLHFEIRYFDDPDTDDYWGFMLQWVTTLGSHQHPMN